MLYTQGVQSSWALFVFLLQNEDTKGKKTTPTEKMHGVTEKANQTKGPEAARKDGASAVADSDKKKKQERNQKPVDKFTER